MLMARKVQIYPSKTAKEKLLFVSDLCTDLHNAALEQRKNRRSWGLEDAFSQKRQLPIIKKDAELLDYKIPSSQVLQNVIIRLGKSYKSFFKKRKNGDKKARPPKFKSKRYFFTQEYSQPDSSFVVDKKGIHLAYGSSKKHWIHIALDDIDLKEILTKSVKTVQITQKKNTNKWFAAISYDVVPPAHVSNDHTLWCDPGSSMLLTCQSSRGLYFSYSIDHLRKKNMQSYKKIDKLTTLRNTTKKGSRKNRRHHAKIKRSFEKINTRSKMILTSLANEMVKDAIKHKINQIKIGDWTTPKTIAKTDNEFVNKQINRAVQNNNPLSKFITILTYKAQLAGIDVSRFDERGTTRTCAMCLTEKKDGLSPSIRVFKCDKCGFTCSRDEHSTLNFIRLNEPAVWNSLYDELKSGFSYRIQRKAIQAFTGKIHIERKLLWASGKEAR